MFDSELNSFLTKFHQLRKSGATAHLDVDTYAGQAWVGLRVMLGPIQHQPSSSQRHRSPSYFRRQERRRAARQSNEESESDKVVTEEVATDSTVENAAKATTTERNAAEAPKVDNDFSCEICDFQSNRRTGLQVHMSRKHATIEQLDGNTSLSNDVDEIVDEEVEHFLQYGFLRDPCFRVPPSGQQLWLYINGEMRKCGLSMEERHAEWELMNIGENRK